MVAFLKRRHFVPNPVQSNYCNRRPVKRRRPLFIHTGYDAFNRLVGRTLTQNTYDGDSLSGTTVTSAHFIYDGDNLVLELGDSGGVEARVLDGPAVDQVLAQE